MQADDEEGEYNRMISPIIIMRCEFGGLVEGGITTSSVVVTDLTLHSTCMIFKPLPKRFD
jgi:hypothetical protein